MDAGGLYVKVLMVCRHNTGYAVHFLCVKVKCKECSFEASKYFMKTKVVVLKRLSDLGGFFRKK
ncbi:hypothetical protein CHS0354_003387 [Potamilus streckersoni]|uniref:Uncharacterized protein n=1 Tax=Potamilus streckersoni TaxID=2493646 RepID=A0AAE0W2Y6_9BIVA|nr:hypothetical protein CHS0354_003387 [Potamilus streckersoni]